MFLQKGFGAGILVVGAGEVFGRQEVCEAVDDLAGQVAHDMAVD